MKEPYDFYENGFGYIRFENLKLGGLPDSLTIEGCRLVVKSEFHISLVWVGRLAEMIDRQNKDKIKADMIEEFEKFTKKYSLENYKLTKKLRLVRRGDQKTVIIITKVPNLDIYFEKMSQKYGVQLPLQPTHITLYTLPTDKIGIGILSEEELNKLSAPIRIPKLQSLVFKD